MGSTVCEYCFEYFLPVEQGQRLCSYICLFRQCTDKKIDVPKDAVVMRRCRVCDQPFSPIFPNQHSCGKECATVSLFRRRVADAHNGEDYSLGEKEHQLPCFRCEHWTVNSESENGGYCDIGRWRICKPYVPGSNKPYKEKKQRAKRNKRTRKK